MKCNLVFFFFLSYQCRLFRRRFPVELAWPPAKEIPNRFWPPLPLLKRRSDARTHPTELHEKSKKKKRKTEKNGIIIHKNKTLSRVSQIEWMHKNEICVWEEKKKEGRKKKESESKKETINARVIVEVDVDLFLSSKKKERRRSYSCR